MKVALVGPCASGKTTLGKRLRQLGYSVVEPAQEHSSVPDLYRRSGPDAVVFLDASWETLHARRGERFQTIRAQRTRLAQAQERCDVYVNTDQLSIDEVLGEVVKRLEGTRKLEARRVSRTQARDAGPPGA